MSDTGALSTSSHEWLDRHRLLPVLVVHDPAEASFLAAGLVAGGLPVAEVTFRTPAAAEAIRLLAARGDLHVGAGTVLRPAQVDEAVRAGARFVVSPGFSRSVVERCQQLDVPVLPGAVTASEVMAAMECGLDTVKFFPAATAGGTRAITALAAAFPAVRFVPTGGIGPDNLASYLALPSVRAVGGSWMLPSSAVTARDPEAIKAHVAAATAIAASHRAHWLTKKDDQP
jgi:2-dehydro-3-deoxyphosphogluconate aldolase/(4S)-4-hydroxy-2-oxoglutarate aldolase